MANNTPIAQIIKYEGDNTTFIWKHPIEDFYTGTQLIVHESQEAIFFMNGQALDLFGAGRHTLETQNLPLVGKFFNRATGDETPFHCEIYFINKTEQMAIKWGTDSKVEYVEPTYGFPIKIGASGEMNLLAEDARKLLIKVVGTEHGITQAALVAKLRALLMVHVKTYLAQTIRTQKINIFEIDEQLMAMSQTLKGMLQPDFEDYGLNLARFYITTIVKPEEDRQYLRFKELHFRQYADVAEAKLNQQVDIIRQQTQAQKMVIESQGIAQKRAQEGYSYQDERGFDVAEKLAVNEAVGQFTNMGVGLGMMTGIGGSVGSAVGGMMQGTMDGILNPAPLAAGMAMGAAAAPTIACPNCQKPVPQGSKFCLECGTPMKKQEEAK